MLSVKTKISNEKKLASRVYAPAALAFAFGFICSGAKLLGSPFSLGVSVCAVSGSFSPAAMLGMCLYYIISGGFFDHAAKLCSAVLVSLADVYVGRSKMFKPVMLCITSCTVMLLVNSVEAIGKGYSGYALAFNLIDAVICSCIVFMYSYLADEYSVTKSLNLLGLRGVFAAVLFVFLTLSLCSVPFPLDLGRVFASVVILYFAKKYRAVGGAVVGVLTSCAVALFDPRLAANTLIMASSGLICGALFTLSDLAAIAAFIISTVISLTAVGINSDTFVMFWDVIVGSAVSVLLPGELFKSGRALFTTSKSTVDLVGQTASSRLGYAAKTISEVRRDISFISCKIEDRYKHTPLSARVEQIACTECECYDICKRSNNTDLLKGLTTLESISKSYGEITLEDIENFLPCCTKKHLVEAAFITASDELAFESANDIGVAKLRELLCEQLLSMEELLNDMSLRVCRIKEVDELLCERAKELFDISGCKGARVCVYTNENRRRFVEAFINGGFKSDMVRLTVKLSDIVGCDMELPSISVMGKVTRLVFTEKPELEANISTFQASCCGGEYCGDTVDTLTLNESERYVILSDGMGTGERARLDSMFTVSLVRRLISSGLSMSCTERLINSALGVKSWDESFSTLDILKLDLFSHTASFLKAGAASSYIIREGSVIKVACRALPAGILTGADPDITRLKICPGDMIIVTSDGVDESVVVDNDELLDKISCSSPDIASRLVGESALKTSGESVSDDITVAAVRIDRCVM